MAFKMDFRVMIPSKTPSSETTGRKDSSTNLCKALPIRFCHMNDVHG